MMNDSKKDMKEIVKNAFTEGKEAALPKKDSFEHIKSLMGSFERISYL